MDFQNPDRRVTLIALDEKWTRLLPWAVVAAIGLLAFGMPGTPEVKAKPIGEIRSKFEYILLEPQPDGTLRATRGLTFDECLERELILAERELERLTQPDAMPREGPRPDCVAGDLIEEPRS